MPSNLTRRISALEDRDAGKGVVVVIRYEDETQDEAGAKHLAAGGADPATGEITVIINHPGPRPGVPATAEVTRRDAGEADLARVIEERRRRVAELNGVN